MASKQNRFFALFGALLFLFTSSALTIAVIAQSAQDKKNADKAASLASTQQKASADMLQGNPLPNFTPLESIPELRFEDTKVGTGAEIAKGATINFHYTGAVAKTGTVFQSSLDTGQPIEYPLGQLIPGWQEGIPGMKVGGQRRLFIPWQLGYGEAGSPQGGIPAKADLVFDIEVLSVK